MLRGKMAIITGASLGLGREIAKAFVKNGASVCICSRKEDELRAAVETLEQLRTSDEQKIFYAEADVGDPQQMDALFDCTVNESGGFDILVNNAGISGPIGVIEDNDWGEWEHAIRVNLLGMVYCTRKAIKIMKEQGHGGKIVCLSGGGATGPRPNFSAYAASKTAVVRAAETFAVETKEYGIDINCIAPGALNTRMLDEAMDAGEAVLGKEEYGRLVKQRDSGGASLENAAELAVYLASSKSDGISGKLISAVWDDWKTLHERKDEFMGTDVYTLRRIVPEDRK